MHFQKINAGGVYRSDGTSIQIKHHDYLEYRNNSGVVNVSMDYDPGAQEIYVYASQVNTFETEHGMEKILEADQEKIIADLKEGLALLKGKFVVV